MTDPLVLVTGASGYLATHVIQQLQQAGHRVRGTVRNLGNEEKVKPLRELCPDAAHALELVEADLTKPELWEDVIRGCTYVIHTASPFPLKAPKHESEVIKPAVEGTTSVLEACSKVSGVKRVVLTSSVAAVGNGFDENGEFSEDDWTDLNVGTLSAYTKSKTLAEKAAWDYVAGLSKEDTSFELAVINPGFILGPVLCGGWASSMEVTKGLLNREIPMLPHISFSVIDVRQCAEAHVKAMTHPEAAGKRHIVAPQHIWFKDIALLYREVFGPLGYSVPVTVAPYCFLKVYSLCDQRIKGILNQWGKVAKYDQTRMTSVLGIEPRPIRETLVDMAHSMIAKGFIRETAKYSKMKENM